MCPAAPAAPLRHGTVAFSAEPRRCTFHSNKARASERITMQRTLLGLRLTRACTALTGAHRTHAAHVPIDHCGWKARTRSLVTHTAYRIDAECKPI